MAASKPTDLPASVYGCFYGCLSAYYFECLCLCLPPCLPASLPACPTGTKNLMFCTFSVRLLGLKLGICEGWTLIQSFYNCQAYHTWWRWAFLSHIGAVNSLPVYAHLNSWGTLIRLGQAKDGTQPCFINWHMYTPESYHVQNIKNNLMRKKTVTQLNFLNKLLIQWLLEVCHSLCIYCFSGIHPVSCLPSPFTNPSTI